MSLMNSVSPKNSFSAALLRLIVPMVGACGFVLVAVALVCGLTQSKFGVVQAYSKSTKDAGATLFHERGCEHCHGVDGRGGELGPSLSTVGKRLKNEQIAHQIHDGGKSMPAFGDALQPDEIKDLVDYLHAKKKAPKTSYQK
jgi:mono/diheme cytochrome c family protein